MNIVFGANFMGRDEYHELTGRPYLGSVHYGPPLGPLRPRHLPPRGKKQTLVDKVFVQRLTSDRGRECYRPRKWPNMPGRLMYKAWRKYGPLGCRWGVHLAKADIIELDASISQAECTNCHQLVAAKKPRPPDEAEARRWQKSNEKSLKMHEEIVAYHEGRGPCPFCHPPEGQEHTEDCWEAP